MKNIIKSNSHKNIKTAPPFTAALIIRNADSQKNWTNTRIHNF